MLRAYVVGSDTSTKRVAVLRFWRHVPPTCRSRRQIVLKTLTTDCSDGTDLWRRRIASQLPAEGLAQQQLFQLVERGEFPLVDGFETLSFFNESVVNVFEGLFKHE